VDKTDRWIQRAETKKATKSFSSLWNSILDKFWNKFKHLQPEAKLALLREMATIRLENPKSYQGRKNAFHHKNRKFARLFAKPCQCCGSKSEHRHHIITLRNGGPNKIKNLIPLCEWCHCYIHPFMEAPPPKEESMKETMERVARD
jgi:hypothetical protein